MKLLMIDDRIPRMAFGAGYPRANRLINHLLPACERLAFYPLVFPRETLERPAYDLDARVELIMGRGRDGLAATLHEYAGFGFDTLWVSRPENMAVVVGALQSLPDVRARFTLVYDAEAFNAPRNAQMRALAGMPLEPATIAAHEAQEVALAGRADILISVTAAEARVFSERTAKPTFVLGNPVLFNETPAGFDDRRNLGFLGSVRTDSPNEDSLLWYAANVMHPVYARLGAALEVAGVAESPFVGRYGGRELNVLGVVEDSIAFLGRVRVFVAPTRFAAGLPQKLVDAAAAGVPIVTTPLLANQLDWTHEREALVAADPAGFIEACCRLYTQPELWRRLRENALASIRERFGAGVFAAELGAILEALAQRRPPRSQAAVPAGIPRRLPPSARGARREELRIAFINGYRIYPPTNGGHRRILDAYGDLGPDVAVRFYTLGADPLDGGYIAIGDGRTEVRVPKSLAHLRDEAAANGVAGTGVGQIYLSDLAAATPAFGRVLDRALRDCDVVVVGAPYLYRVVRARFAGPVVYHAHDVEAILQRDLVAGAKQAPALLAHVETLERECAQGAELIVAMSDEDVELFAERYGTPRRRMLGFPPAVDRSRTRAPAHRPVIAASRAVFIGSHWRPNVIGVEAIVALAPALPELEFVVVGTVADAFRERSIPPNVRFTGFIDDGTCAALLADADIALNPCQAVSGVNMKMTDYVLAGLPIVATPAGARGLGLVDGRDACLVPLAGFVPALRRLASDPIERLRLATNARARLAEGFDATVQRRVLVTRLRGLLHAAVPEMIGS